MNSTSRKRFAASVLVGAATVALVCGGAAAAHADVAPPTEVPNLGRITFEVPEPFQDHARAVNLHADILDDYLVVIDISPNDVALTLGCDDGRTYPLAVSTTDRGLAVDARLPFYEVGDSCSVSSAPVNGRTVAFSDLRKPRDTDGAEVSFVGVPYTVVPSRRGGQY